GYPAPDIHASAETAVISDSSGVALYGYANFYNKKITIQDYVITPTLNKDYEAFNADQKLRAAMADYPVAWLNDTLLDKTPDSIFTNKRFSIYSDKAAKPVIHSQNGSGNISLTHFSPNSFSFTVNSAVPSILSIFQQYNHNWKIKVNGATAPLLKMNIAFMGIRVPAGESTVEFRYKPSRVMSAIFLSVASIILLILFFILTTLKARRKNDQ
ncbi:MAG: YfhO family protein, partial [Bacteroidota bacterium]